MNCRLNSAYSGNHGYTPTVGNDRLMKYFCGTDETFPSTTGPLIRVSGLPASFLTNGYSIYVCSDFSSNSDNSAPQKIDMGTSLLDTNNQSAGISTISTATIVDSGDWPGSGGGTFTEGATLTINKAVLDAMVKAAGDPRQVDPPDDRRRPDQDRLVPRRGGIPHNNDSRIPRDDLPLDPKAALYYDVGPLRKTP